jgi:RNA 2',3'-cyclic 3'-phosphodiesterase
MCSSVICAISLWTDTARRFDSRTVIIALRAMRLFTAILLPDHVRHHLARTIEHAQNRLDRYLTSRGYSSPDAKWVRSDNLHVTMKFLGELQDSELPRLCEALGAIESIPPMRLRAAHVEFLPPRGPVRIICAAVEGNTELVQLLFSSIERACEPLGIRQEGRKFHPHITLARVRQPFPAQIRGHFPDEIGQMSGPEFESPEFALLQSELLPSGPRYTVLARFPPTRKDS